MIDKDKEMTVDAAATSGPPWMRFIVIAVVVAVLGAFGWYQRHGWEDVAAFGLGIAFGSGLAVIGRLIVKRQVAAEGHAIVSTMMLGSFFSIGAFIVGVLVLALIFKWKTAVLPASSAGLFLYLGAKFFDLWWTQRALSASSDRRSALESK